jgi:drug/metabolite transporter (DMT)-like permease
MSTATATSSARSWLPGYLALAIIWGSSFLFIKVALRDLHPVQVALYRVGFGALVLLVVLLVTRTPLPRSLKLWAHLVVVATFSIALPFSLFSYAEQHISSVLAGIWNATTPLVALPMAVLVYRTDRFTVRRALGLGLGFVGVLTILGVWQGPGDGDLLGQALCFGAAVCYGIAIPYQRKFLAHRPESGTTIAAGQLVMASGLLAIAAPLLAGAPPAPWTLSLPALGSVAAMGALGTGLAFVLSFRVIRAAGVTTATSVTYLIPLWATFFGVVLLHEKLAWYQPVGAAIVLLGVAISQGFTLARRGGRSSRAAPAPATN